MTDTNPRDDYQGHDRDLEEQLAGGDQPGPKGGPKSEPDAEPEAKAAAKK